jgi:hypothetical protein
MKLFTKFLVPMLVLGLVSAADAGKNKKKGHAGLAGTIAGISGDNLSISAGHGKKNKGGQSVTVSTNANTAVSIDGIAGKSVKDLAPGEKVKVNPKGGLATSIIATHSQSHKHKHKHKKSKKA